MHVSLFKDQAEFMTACGQTVDRTNMPQFHLYTKLIREEYEELIDAIEAKNTTQVFDALLDLHAVVAGAGLSLGLPMADGWDLVHLSNMRKVDPETGAVKRSTDGKILKPEGWKPPNLQRLLENQHAKLSELQA